MNLYKVSRTHLCALLTMMVVQTSVASTSFNGLSENIRTEIEHASVARPPNLHRLTQIAVENPSQAGLIASYYVSRIDASGHEAGLIAASVAEAIGADAQRACEVASAVCNASRADIRDAKIICTKVARTLPASHGQNSATDPFTECLTAELGISEAQAYQLTGRGSYATPLDQTGSTFLLNHNERSLGSGGSVEATVGSTQAGVQRSESEDVVEREEQRGQAVLSEGAAIEQLDIDGGRKKRKRRVSRSE